MGHKEKTKKIDVQKQRIKDIILSMLTTNENIMRFQLTLTDKKEEIKGFKHFIKETQKAKEIVSSITHYEILVSLYNAFINGKESYYLTLCRTITNKTTIVKWDRTEKGFKLFMELESQARAKSEQEMKERVKNQEIIKKAKEEGKKVEMVYMDGKVEPRIVETKPN